MLLISEIQTVKERLCTSNQHYRPVIYHWEGENDTDTDTETETERLAVDVQIGAYLLLSILYSLLTLIKEGGTEGQTTENGDPDATGKIMKRQMCWCMEQTLNFRRNRLMKRVNWEIETYGSRGQNINKQLGERGRSSWRVLWRRSVLICRPPINNSMKLKHLIWIKASNWIDPMQLMQPSVSFLGACSYGFTFSLLYRIGPHPRSLKSRARCTVIMM